MIREIFSYKYKIIRKICFKYRLKLYLGIPNWLTERYRMPCDCPNNSLGVGFACVTGTTVDDLYTSN